MVMTPGGKQKKRSLSHSPDGGLSGKKKKLSQGGGAVQTPPAKPKQTDVNLFKQINSKKSPVAQMTPGKKQLEKKQKNKPNKAALISQKEDSDSDDDEDDDEDDEDDDDDSSDENNVANKSLQNKNKNVNASVIKTDNANDDDEDDDDDEEDDDEEDDDDEDDDDDDDDEEDDENQVTLNKQQPKGNQINSQKKETGNVNKPLLGEHANEEESSDDDDDDDDDDDEEEDDDDEEEDDDSSDNDDTPGQKVAPKKPKLDGAQQEASPSQKQRFAMFVTNISSRCDKQKLKELFEKVVPVKDINILPNRGDKWAAVVVLNNEEDQKKSLSLHQNMVEGKRICIVYSDQTRNNEGGGGGGGFRGRGGRGFGGGRGGSPGRGGFRGGRGGQGDFRGGRGGQRDFRGGGGRGGQGGFRGGRGGQGFPKGDKSPGEKRTFGDMRNSGQGVNTKKTFGDD